MTELPKIKHYLYNGQNYSLRDLEKLTGIPHGTLYYRIDECGMSVETAISFGCNRPKGKMFYYDGELLSISQIARRTGISDTVLRKRLALRYSIEHAASKNPPKLPARTVEHDELAHTVLQDQQTSTSEADIQCRKLARKIFLQIVCANPDDVHPKCVVPEREYTFAGTILKLRVTFGASHRNARLTAEYLEGGFPSTLNRVYAIEQDRVKELRNNMPLVIPV